MALSLCPDCRKGTLHWDTDREGPRPVDRLLCDRCGYVVAVEDWHIPATAMREGRCRNCGGIFHRDACLDCGLSSAEDREVHEELRALVHPTAHQLACARLAMAMGRRLIALKLATAAAHDGATPEVARTLRVNLLQQIGEENAALADARQWTADHPGSASAWATFASQLVLRGRVGEAVAAFRKALDIDPDANRVRAKLAQLYLDLERFGQAQAAARRVLSQPGDREATLAALEVMARYVELLIRQEDTGAVDEVIEALGPRSRRHPVFLCASAWLALHKGNTSAARRELKQARKLAAEHPLVEEVEGMIKGRRRWWW